VHSGGAKFDYEKAKWFNHEWIKKLEVGGLKLEVKKVLAAKGIVATDESFLEKVIELVKDRCVLLTDFYDQSAFFFQSPATIDTNTIKAKWDEKKKLFFIELIRSFELASLWQHDHLESSFKELAAANQLKPGELMLPFRIMLVGGKFGPGVFDIAVVLGKEETIRRVRHALSLL
jgi:glutamyl-tRNA synthetase